MLEDHVRLSEIQAGAELRRQLLAGRLADPAAHLEAVRAGIEFERRLIDACRLAGADDFDE